MTEASDQTLNSLAFRSELIRMAHNGRQEIELSRLVKSAINDLNTDLVRSFEGQQSVQALMRHRSDCIDSVLAVLWQVFVSPNLTAPASLLACGGYGRRELVLHSDIDLLFLFDDEFALNNQQEIISQFVAFLWDTGLQVSHSVCALEHSITQAKADISIATNLMEARMLAGDGALFDQLQRVILNEDTISSLEFFQSKLKEQQLRHHKHGNTECSLEPNVKNAPGGLRDVQTLVWITRKQFGLEHLNELVHHNILTHNELKALELAQGVLLRIRYGLHCIAGRDENRLLFDYQKNLATKLGYSGTGHNQTIESLMQDYYRAAMTISEINEQVMQQFQEEIIHRQDSHEIHILDPMFQVHDKHLEVRDKALFRNHPSALLKIFITLAQNPEIEGIKASTIRLIRSHAYLIDEQFRSKPSNRELFLQLLRSPHRLYTQLRRMKRYGVLAQYIPAFQHTVGQMQYDLFHVYTVDAHILYVVRNIRRFMVPQLAQAFPLATKITKKVPKKEILYLAALFHDMAKGRNGDHSELGAVDAEIFCKEHNLSQKESNQVAWLVKYHLLMSSTAQKKDISDPTVIREFALKVKDLKMLDYLYVLTVADINGTNPKLWNTWRDALLTRLYQETRRTLTRGLFNPIENNEKITEHRQEAMGLLKANGIEEAYILKWWQTLSDEYFLRETPENIAWHTQLKIKHGDHNTPLVAVQEVEDDTAAGDDQRTLQVFICSQDLPNLFLASVSTIDRLGLTIVDAKIITAPDGLSLDTYLVMDSQHSAMPLSSQISTIEKALTEQLTKLKNFKYQATRRLPRELRHFEVKTEVRMSDDATGLRTLLEVITLDRPGLLAIIANHFREFAIEVHSARIATIGERAEDTFVVTDTNHQPIQDPATRKQICQTLTESLAKTPN